MIFGDFYKRNYQTGDEYEIRIETLGEKLNIKIYKNRSDIIADKTIDIEFLLKLDDSILLALKELVNKK